MNTKKKDNYVQRQGPVKFPKCSTFQCKKKKNTKISSLFGK